MQDVEYCTTQLIDLPSNLLDFGLGIAASYGDKEILILVGVKKCGIFVLNTGTFECREQSCQAETAFIIVPDNRKTENRKLAESRRGEFFTIAATTGGAHQIINYSHQTHVLKSVLKMY